MFSKVGKILFISFALLFVFAKAEEDAVKSEEITSDDQESTKPEELDFSTFSEDEEAMNDPADSEKTADDDKEKRLVRKKFVPFYRCPFDCGKSCVVKRFLKAVKVRKSTRFVYGYVCFIGVYNCCKGCCKTYRKCRIQNNPDWLCYAQALSCICRCRNINPLRG